MNKLLLSFFLFCIIGLSSGIISVTGHGGSVAMADTTDRNPNGSSELSLLMRKMYDHTLEAKKALEQKKVAPSPKSFTAIKTATPTDGETKNQYYDTFADIYLQSLDTYNHSGKKTLAKNYNALINSCLACHSSHCPGPVPKIKRLLLPVTP